LEIISTCLSEIKTGQSYSCTQQDCKFAERKLRSLMLLSPVHYVTLQ